MELLKKIQNKGKMTKEDLETIKVYVLRELDPESLEILYDKRAVRIDGILIGQCNENYKDFKFVQQFKLLEKIEHFRGMIQRKLLGDIDETFEARVQRLEDNKTLSPEAEIQVLLQKIKNSKYEELSLWEKAVKLSEPNEYGESKIIKFEILPDKLKELESKNGGTWFRSSSGIHKYFEVNIIRQNPENLTSSVVGYQITGFSEAYKTISNYIPQKIKDRLKGEPCVVSGKVHDVMEIDHKIGLKEFQRKDDKRLKDFKYYQPMSNTINCAKREHCKNCKISGKRFDARQLGFEFPVTEGKITHDFSDNKIKFSEEENPCKGCYWYDPRKFVKAHTDLIKEKVKSDLKKGK